MALLRNCRFVASVKMHCQGMRVEEAVQLFMDKALISKEAATMEARRGTVNPMYINYTLGKLLILKLRTDYQSEQGEAFSLKEFHDLLMTFGGGPIPLIRQYILKTSASRTDLL